MTKLIATLTIALILLVLTFGIFQGAGSNPGIKNTVSDGTKRVANTVRGFDYVSN